MTDFLANPIVRAAITGLVTAAAVDFQAFRTWKSFDDAKAYSWSVAGWRWFQGAVIGAVSALGMGAVLG
jgi:hypothetical protein